MVSENHLGTRSADLIHAILGTLRTTRPVEDVPQEHHRTTSGHGNRRIHELWTGMNVSHENLLFLHSDLLFIGPECVIFYFHFVPFGVVKHHHLEQPWILFGNKKKMAYT